MEHNWGIIGKFWSIVQKHNRQFEKHNRPRPMQQSFFILYLIRSIIVAIILAWYVMV